MEILCKNFGKQDITFIVEILSFIVQNYKG